MPRLQYWMDHAGDWRVRLVGGNGEIVMVSEGYSSEDEARRAIDRVKRLVPDAVPERRAGVVALQQRAARATAAERRRVVGGLARQLTAGRRP
jgi:uncharacterized protein YegP (UPF0339 family)